MKIVGTINGQNVLAEITVQEIDFLAGRRIGYQGNYHDERNIPAGTTFDIIKAFEQIHRNDRRRHEVDIARKTLEGVLNSLDIIDRFIDEPKEDAQEQL